MGNVVSEVNRHGPGSSCGIGEVQQKHVRLVRDQPQRNTPAYVVMSVCMLASGVEVACDVAMACEYHHLQHVERACSYKHGAQWSIGDG